MLESLETVLQKIQVMKSFHLENSFEIYFDRQLATPYFALDSVMEQFPEYGGDAIYMILQTDRLELTGVDMAHDPPVILYRNCATGKTFGIDNLWYFPHPIPKAALEMRILSGALLEVGVKEAWRRRNPRLAGFAPRKISVYDLVTQSGREKETVSPFGLLYIGSAQKDVYHRLTHHETMLKIYRDTASTRPNQEIFVWLLKPQAKFFKQADGGTVSMITTTAHWQECGPFGIRLDSQQLLLVTEAMLIHFFKPPYNKQHVGRLPSLSHATYARLHQAGVRNLQINLNLFMQTYQNVLWLQTDAADTAKAKNVSIFGALEELKKSPNDCVLSAERMPDDVYAFLMEETV